MRSIDTIVEPHEDDDDLTVEEAGGRCGDLPREEVEDDLVVEEAREELTGFLSFGDVVGRGWRW